MAKLLVLLNPVAGRGKALKALPRIEKTLREMGLDYDLARTTAPDDATNMAREAAKAGVKIYTVALGTDQGVLRTTRKDGSIREQPVPPDRETLSQVAKISGGEAFDAPDAAALDRVYEQLGRQVAEKKEVREITAGFAGGSLLLLVLGAGASMALLGRLP